MDRETVITHLLLIDTWAEYFLEHHLQSYFTAKHLEDIAQWTKDAIALLNKQQKLIDEIMQRRANNGEFD